MYPLIRCPGCNNSLGEITELYVMLRRYKISKQVDTDKQAKELEMDTDMDVHTDDCFEYLGIDRMCCKAALIGNFQLDDLIYDTH